MSASTNEHSVDDDHEVADICNTYLRAMLEEIEKQGKCKTCAFQHTAEFAVINSMVRIALSRNMDYISSDHLETVLSTVYDEVTDTLNTENFVIRDLEVNRRQN